jgi:uncharacterized protein YdeI (YjbR/CyaY-like superfamily)
MPHDKHSWLQKFTPRRAKSAWSKLNTEHAERLIKSGQMARAGLKVMEAAKADGGWRAAYDSPRNAGPPGDFLAALNKRRRKRSLIRSVKQTSTLSCIAFKKPP